MPKALQLFSAPVPADLIEAVAHAFGLDSLDDRRFFSRTEIARLGTVEAVTELVPALEEYYLPCKAKVYLRDLSTRSVVTVLRQLLRLADRALESREVNVMMNAKPAKLLLYSLRRVGNPASRMSKVHVRYELSWDNGRLTNADADSPSSASAEAAT